MTIKDFIIEGTILALTERWQKLRDLGAPTVMITSIEEELERLSNKELKCAGEIELLDEELISHEQRKGKGGKEYHVFNGNINYFPRAKYGRFIAKGERVSI